MPFQARQVVEELHAQVQVQVPAQVPAQVRAAAAAQALLTLAAPALAPAFPGGFAPLAGAAAPRRPRPGPDWEPEPDPAAEATPEGDLDRAAILAEIRALTEDLERRNRRAEDRRPHSPLSAPLSALVAAGRRWI